MFTQTGIMLTNKDLLYSKGNFAWCYVAASMGGEFWGERTYVYVSLSPFTVLLETVTTSLIGYTLI